MTKDEHVKIICDKYNAYKAVMEKEFPGDDYPFCNLTPWTNYYVEDEQIDKEDLEFEKFYDINNNVNGTTCSKAGDRPLQG